jgi:hypothetical protein
VRAQTSEVLIDWQARRDGRQQRIEDKADSNVRQNQWFPQSAVVVGRRGEMISVMRPSGVAADESRSLIGKTC